MLLIVAHHYVVNSGLFDADGPIFSNPRSWNSWFLLVFGAWGKIGINCFVLITGYYMCKSHITVKKFAKLLLEIMFYRIVIQSIFWITGYEAFSIRSLVLTLIPVKSISVGFSSCYIVFFLIIPFLNVLISHLKERQHLLLLLWCGFTYVFLGSVYGFGIKMNYVSWFIVLYLISSFFRLYPHRVFQKTKLWGVLMICLLVLDAFSVVAYSRSWLGPYYFVSDSNVFLAVATGICSFLFFKNLNIKKNTIINTVAASTFGVLLIHAHSDTMRKWLWRDVVDCAGHYDSPYMPIYAIGSVLTIFVVCVIIDQLRIRFLEKPFFRFWDRHWNVIVEKHEHFKNILMKKLNISE